MQKAFSRPRKSTVTSDDGEEEQELSLDLWEGQFEFVGSDYPQTPRPQDPDDLFHPPAPSPQLNGVRKNTAHVWCEGITDQVRRNHVQMLQQQMTVLADNQTSTDDRYTRAKQDSAALQARVHMLEEQLREAELRAEDRLADEQKRHRELMTRVEREKQLQIENCSIRLQTLEVEGATMREESTRLRIQVDRLRIEKENAQEKLEEAESEVTRLRSETVNVREMERRLKEEAARKIAANSQLVEDLSREVERLRVRGSEVNGLQGHDQAVDDDLTSRLVDLQKEVISLRQQNKSLEESNEELQAQMLSRSLEEGRHLLTGTSLAAEFEAMSHGELRDIAQEEISTEKMRTALKEQQEVNSQLRCYIDGILLNIVENYPQLLEVKRNHM